MMGKITSNILILVKCRNHQRQFVQTEMEGKGWAEGDTGGGDGGRGVADAPTLWPLGAMSTPAFAIQASEWFDLVPRAHDVTGGSCPGSCFQALRFAR